MSDHDAAPDPMDKAYAQAEAVLTDEAARAARRGRVLAAVAGAPATPPVEAAPPTRRTAWRHGGWLVAAGVAGLSILITTQIYAPPSVRKPPSPPTRAAPVAAESDAAASDAAAPPPTSAGAPAQAPRPEPEARAAAPRRATPSPVIAPPAAPPPPPAPVLAAQAPQPFPAAAPPALEGVVTAQRRESRLEEEPRIEEIVPSARSSSPRADHAGAPAPGRSRAAKAAAPSDGAERLHAAAAAGRTAELADLLADGVPVDAPDVDGETALMKSIQADQPAAAALLRRHGARLDRKNHAGDSAKDMATAIGDAELDQALGLDR
jgi:hypothetical protein